MQLYPFQQRVKDLIEKGNSVILQAPTGTGKTCAALAPFIEAFFDGPPDAFPRKCIYSVPMRVLANQFIAHYNDLAGKYRTKYRRTLSVNIQTGDRPDDPKLQSNLIFTTIDQTLSNFLNIPYGLGLGSANLNAGAILSSYLVFDELHLYDPDTMLPTTLEMLRVVKGITPFILMTATFSGSMLQRLGTMLDATVVPESSDDRTNMATIGSQEGKQRFFHTQDIPLTAAQVLDPAKAGRRTICICNTVRASQELYRNIKQELEKIGDRETQVCLLHARFYKDDRDQKEKWVRDEFGKGQDEYDGPRLILIATQVIEVGVDATCDYLHTELAPAASILQRAGRCARRAYETGHVYIYLPRNENGEPNFSPYALKSKPRDNPRGLRLCQATWDALTSSQFDGQNMDFTLEQSLIDWVHTPIDEEILDSMQANRGITRDLISRTMREQDIAASGQLIRPDSENRYVFVHPNPETDPDLAINPWRYDGFTLTPGTIAREFDNLNNDVTNIDDTPWLMKAARQVNDNRQENEQQTERQPKEYLWYSIQEKGEVFKNFIIALHPSIAAYDTELGFRLEPSTGETELRFKKRHFQYEAYSYQHESYSEHVAGLYRSYTQALQAGSKGITWLPLKDETAYIRTKLEERMRLPAGTLDQMLRAIFACHDLGKLDTQWQKWAHDWQKIAGQFFNDADLTLTDHYMIAHTDYDAFDKAQRKAQRLLPSRPNHAGEAATASVEVIYQLCGNSEPLWKAALTAIGRHHSAATSHYQAYQLHSHALESIKEAFQVVDLPAALANRITLQNDGKNNFSQLLVNFDLKSTEELLLYFFFIRILRLADQRSQIRS